MATIEERLTALEQENAALRKSDELQTIALRALATKDEFTKLRETNNNLFDALISHDQLTNERLGDLQTQVIELDGKIVGLQTEMHMGFKDMQNQLIELNGKFVGLQVETRQGFKEQDKQIAGLQSEVTTQGQKLDGLQSEVATLHSEVTTQGQKLDGLQSEVTTQGQKLDQVLVLLTTLVPKPE